MHILSIALGGCLRSEPVSYGITEDTGGHITYILGEMEALSRQPQVRCAEIVTRLFDAPELGAIHAQRQERLNPKLSITRIDSGNRAYLAKEALAADRAAFTRALIAELESRDTLPTCIHAHFADAAEVAASVRDALGIPFVYTAHSLGIDKRDAMDSATDPVLEARIAQEDRAIAAADAVVGSSRDECERQLLAYPSARWESVHRLRPGIVRRKPDAAEMAHARRSIAPFLRHPDRPIVLAVARPVRKKNLAALVDAFAMEDGLRDRANLVIFAGLRDSIDSGEEEQVATLHGIVDAIDRHDLYGHVAYPRRHSQADVSGIFALAKESGGVFVNPALVEPYGLTLVEAGMWGLPVVATRNGGPVDILQELGHGVLVDPTDPSAIGAGIAGLLDDRQAWRTASDNGRIRSRTMDWDHYAKGFVAIVADITARRYRPVRYMPGVAPRRLLLSDIDNTLTGCTRGADRFGAFVRRSRSIAFGVATGRSLVEARRIVREWNLPRPTVWITSVGTEIYWDDDGQPVTDGRYAKAIADGWEPDALNAIARSVPGVEPQPEVDQRLFKRSYFAPDPASVIAIRAKADAAGLPCRVIHSHDRLLDIIPAGAGKAAAMRHVADWLRLPLGSVIAAGDSGNDLDMIESCPNAVIVGNCEQSLKLLANRPNVYLSKRHHAEGALEGVLSYLSRERASRRKQAA